LSGNGNPGCLGALFGLKAGPEETSPAGDLPYRLRDDFLSPAELSFYRALAVAVGSRAIVCPKVNLSDVMFVARPNENTGARGRISQKHVDFLVCDPASMRPLAGVELDDSSHQRQDRQARDEFVDSVFAAASLPLIHVPVRPSYAPAEIAPLLSQYISTAAAAQAVPGPAVPPQTVSTYQPVVASSAAVPICPKCGIPMVLRTAGRGDRQGQQFYGCANYPKCRETAQL
jgi:predicted RNA-binding Zn-ribbon protein involved in translation (DUF1610 family)